MKLSIIVPTYNRPQALRLCLLSLSKQSLLPTEVLIADDGSGPETRETVVAMQKELKQFFPILHVWQEDVGFRKPKIINETVRQSSGDYLIFIDGDCMAHRHFIRSHIGESSRDAILSGRRVDIGKRMSERLLEKQRIINGFSPMLVWDAVMGGQAKSRKVEEALRITSKLLRRLMHRDRITDDGVWGCNFSLYRDLFYAINGCDEDFLDGSIEDNDLGIRVLNLGSRVKSVRGLANVFHLWHKSSWSFQNDKYQHNQEILKRRIAYKETFCKAGIRSRLEQKTEGKQA
jgi:glycosyltransferase involved in cell wall biosynthesis